MGLDLPFVYPPPPQATSDTIGRIVPDSMLVNLYHGLIRLVHTYRIPSRTMERIHSMIRASFRLLIETLKHRNRLGESPEIRPGLLAAVTASSEFPLL